MEALKHNGHYFIHDSHSKPELILIDSCNDETPKLSDEQRLAVYEKFTKWCNDNKEAIG